MSFNPAIPEVGNFTLNSYRQIRTNFNVINRAFADNHIGLTSDQQFAGLHSVVTFNPQAAMTAPVTSSVQVGLYNQLVGNSPNLFFAPSSSQTPIQLTYETLKSDRSDTQYTFMAGPFIVYAGAFRDQNASSSPIAVSLSPGSKLIYVNVQMANITAIVGTVIKTASVTDLSGTTFNIRVPAYMPFAGIPDKYDVYYFAVGLP